MTTNRILKDVTVEYGSGPTREECITKFDFNDASSLVQSRIHEADVAGQILVGPVDWKQISFPADPTEVK